MRLTIIQTGDVPEPLRRRFGPYGAMFERMFETTGMGFTHNTIKIAEGEPFPDPSALEGIVLTGSAAGVYEAHAWLDPLREFIRAAYRAQTPMLGVCFGHQIMADALGGTVQKSEKGWGLGRHTYTITSSGTDLGEIGHALAVACSHQDQVIALPPGAEVTLASDFTPYAGLRYANGAALSFQAHPEFEDDYALALAELRRGRAPDTIVDAAAASLATPSDSPHVAKAIGRFFRER